MARSAFFMGFSLEWSSFDDKPNTKVVVSIDTLFKLLPKTLRHNYDAGHPLSVVSITRICKERPLQKEVRKGCNIYESGNVSFTTFIKIIKLRFSARHIQVDHSAR
jgi:hypothetical protein